MTDPPTVENNQLEMTKQKKADICVTFMRTDSTNIALMKCIIKARRNSPAVLDSYLCHKACGCIAECFQHGRGLRVEQRHPVGHLVVDFILYVQLWVQK